MNTEKEQPKKEYWRWKEYNWKNPDIPDWKGSLVTAGVDVGSTSSQAVAVRTRCPVASDESCHLVTR